MSCSPFDLRDYFFGELPEEDRRQADLHIQSCLSCREEVDRLRSTQAALLTIADEEIPQRIGFVSDRAPEPSPMRRWWLGFASAAMLSAAIVVSAVQRPAPTAADFERQVNEAVAKAVAENDARHEERTAKLLDVAARYAAREHRAVYFPEGSR